MGHTLELRHFPVLLGLALLSALSLFAQADSDWTWKDRSGRTRTRADMDSILAAHTQWLESEHKSGTRADLSRADLLIADLTGVDLTGADLHGASIVFADLSGATLVEADLTGASLVETKLNGANLSYAELKEANLYGTDLAGVVFEPNSLPDVRAIATAKGLDQLTYRRFPDAMARLRKQFQDNGFSEQGRSVTFALNKVQSASEWNLCRSGSEWRSCLSAGFRTVFFDWTCRYGMNPGRALRLLLIFWLVFSCAYAGFMVMPGPSGIYLVVRKQLRGGEIVQGIQIRAWRMSKAKSWRHPWHKIRHYGQMARAATFFSLMTAFNIGFREINVGQWLRMLTTREYTLKAVKWARPVAGIQSLLSVYLMAMWVRSAV
jgi:hypothetical protein